MQKPMERGRQLAGRATGAVNSKLEAEAYLKPPRQERGQCGWHRAPAVEMADSQGRDETTQVVSVQGEDWRAQEGAVEGKGAEEGKPGQDGHRGEWSLKARMKREFPGTQG